MHTPRLPSHGPLPSVALLPVYCALPTGQGHLSPDRPVAPIPRTSGRAIASDRPRRQRRTPPPSMLLPGAARGGSGTSSEAVAQETTPEQRRSVGSAGPVLRVVAGRFVQPWPLRSSDGLSPRPIAARLPVPDAEERGRGPRRPHRGPRWGRRGLIVAVVAPIAEQARYRGAWRAIRTSSTARRVWDALRGRRPGIAGRSRRGAPADRPGRGAAPYSGPLRRPWLLQTVDDESWRRPESLQVQIRRWPESRLCRATAPETGSRVFPAAFPYSSAQSQRPRPARSRSR